MSDAHPASGAPTEFGAVRPASGAPARSGLLMVTASGAQLAIGALSVAVLARVLTPADFGLFTMAGFLIGMAIGLRDFGLQLATVQSPELSEERVSALFRLNLWLSLALALLLAAAGPLLAWFFDEPRLVGVTAVLGAGVGVAAAGNIHQGLLIRGMRFRAIAAIEFAAALLGAGLGIAAALAGAGYRALVLQQLAFLVLLGLLPFWFCRWRPRLARGGLAGSGALVRYGRDLTLARVVTQLSSNLDYVLIGRFAGATPLGLYQAAFRWAMLPTWQLYLPLTNVVVSAQSRFRADVERYRASFHAAVQGTAAIVLPVLALLFVAASDVIRLLLGSQWDAAVPMFRALLVAAFCDVPRLSCRWAYFSEGRMRRHLHWNLFAAPVLMAGVALGMVGGATGVATGYAAATAALAYPGVAYCMADSVLTRKDFWQPVTAPAVSALAAAAILLVVRALLDLDWPLLPWLATQTVVFCALYAALWRALPTRFRAAGGLAGTVRRLWQAARS